MRFNYKRPHLYVIFNSWQPQLIHLLCDSFELLHDEQQLLSHQPYALHDENGLLYVNELIDCGQISKIWLVTPLGVVIHLSDAHLYELISYLNEEIFEMLDVLNEPFHHELKHGEPILHDELCVEKNYPRFHLYGVLRMI